MTQPNIILITHNIRSTHNIGSLFRTAEGCGVEKIIISGYSPYPTQPNDKRLPHISNRLTQQIHKTALGAETIVPFEYCPNPPLQKLRTEGYRIVALEQASNSINLYDFKPANKLALLVGEEVYGVKPNLLALCDDIIEIPMRGQKESFNVSVATGMALYEMCLRH